MLYDAIVVGSGPGGAIAASVLAERGKSVLLADRQAFPRDKICGDGLPANVMLMLRNLGVDVRTANLDYQQIKALSITGPAGQTLVTHEGVRDVFSMTSRRYSFDNMLHEHAVSSGAKFEVMNVQGPLFDLSGDKVVGVIERKDKQTIEHEAKVVIAADGAGSSIARALNAKEDRVAPADATAVGIRAYGKLKREIPSCVYFYFHKSLLPGYGWIFPIANGYANIGVYLDNKSYKQGKRTLPDLLNEFEDGLPPEFALEVDPATVQTWPLPLWTNSDTRKVKGVLLVGDAGRFTNAITGGGIYTAMMTGLFAAHHAIDLLDGTSTHADYDAAWQAELRKSLAQARFIQQRIAPSALLFNSIFTITRFPPIKSTMLRALSGEHY